MLPKNLQRKSYLERIHVHRGPFHPSHAQNLPQFGFEKPYDPNVLLGYDLLTPKTAKVIFETGPIDKLKDFEREIQHDGSWPIATYPKTHTYNRKNFKVDRYRKTLFRKFKKYKEHK